jgi:hypothetical protein
MFYQERHEAKGAVIGTIMAWTGGLSSIPHGWVICDGATLAADEFPLLAATIGDSYNMGSSSNFTGTFPSYNGAITLPDLNGRMLMDIENDYFPLTGRAADSDTDARSIMSSIVGSKKQNTQGMALTGSYTDITTDIIFQISPSDRTGYQGKITGNTILAGEGTKTVYVAPRKLGRKHITRHNHPGNVSTIRNDDPRYPGDGVVPYFPISYTLYVSAVDIDSGGDVGDVGDGDLIFFGWTDNNIQGRHTGDPTERSEVGTPVNIRPGIIGGLFGNFQSVNDAPNYPALLSYRWPEQGNNGEESPDGRNDGVPNKVFGLSYSESPPINLKPRELRYTPLTPAFLDTDKHEDAYFIGGPNEQSIPYGAGGNEVNVPVGIRNYFNDTQPENDVSGRTLLSHPAYDFLADAPGTDKIYPHDHGTFDIDFDSTRLKPQSSILANVNLPPSTNPDNTQNEGALSIEFTTAQPKLTCIYIIRAY